VSTGTLAKRRPDRGGVYGVRWGCALIRDPAGSPLRQPKSLFGHLDRDSSSRRAHQFPVRSPQGVDLEQLVSDRALQTPVLALERFQPLGVVGRETAVLNSPAMQRLLGYLPKCFATAPTSWTSPSGLSAFLS
jgi:hypothetical protein